MTRQTGGRGLAKSGITRHDAHLERHVRRVMLCDASCLLIFDRLDEDYGFNASDDCVLMHSDMF